AAHIEADALQEMIVSGGEWPQAQLEVEPARQILLRARNAALLAESFLRAGIVPVIDDVVVTRTHMEFYLSRLAALPLRVVVHAPRVEVTVARDHARTAKTVGETWTFLDAAMRDGLAGIGTWLDTSDVDGGDDGGAGAGGSRDRSRSAII
ncbi:MAG: AAA family ATPase, partial [Tepidiformaceae bacterium]